MTYCVGIMTAQGLVMASDSRTSAGPDQVSTCRKIHTFTREGERVFVLLTSGNLSISQSIITQLRREWNQGEGLASAPSLYDAARVIGDQVRRVSEQDRAALDLDGVAFNVHLLLGGQIRDQVHDLYLIYPQGNPISASEDSPYLQIGDTKYGRPILDRGLRYDHTTLEEAAKYALISLDSTMRSNVGVGPPIDMVVYEKDDLTLGRYRRFREQDADLVTIRRQWEESLRRAVQELPDIRYLDSDPVMIAKLAREP